ncbi:hypothetical protein ZOSMA_157G00240 [Zostera marina]|uniref:Uncharacterized protein n=1 Tax=Zostera marina TaxID=29655 RepID=A0A0K9PVH6_ZOSMR|nr:hypothetical protein ZOSMA_157G00240 [Zostera marina]
MNSQDGSSLAVVRSGTETGSGIQ